MSLTKVSYQLINGAPINVVDYGCVADGVTDNTTAITNLFTALGSSYSGVITIPYGVKYTFNTVAPLAPKRAEIIDNSLINGWDTSGFRQKIISFWESGDSTGVVDQNIVISSGHNAAFYLENTGTSGSSSGNNRVAATHWSTGRFSEGQPGIRGVSTMQWIQAQGRTTKWWYSLRKTVPWVARDYEYWGSGRSVITGDYVISQVSSGGSGYLYIATSTGTTGSTAPTGTGTGISDGGVTWNYVTSSVDVLTFAVDEDGRISTNSSTSGGYTYRFKQGADDSDSVLATFEGTGINKSVTLALVATDSGGNAVAAPTINATTAGELRISGNRILAEVTGSVFDIASFGRRQANATNGDTTPSVSAIGCLVINNSAPTSITNFTDYASTQEVMLIFANSNTTLVNSASLVLKGGVNVTPAANNVIVIKRFGAFSSAWIEVSRSF